MNKTEEFIIKAKKVHGDKYDYSKVNYIKSSQKVCIICPEHGEFLQTPNNHLTGYQCKKCGRKQATIKNSLTTDQFVEKAKLTHGDKYDYSKVQYINNKTKVKIICPIHGEFEIIPDSHLSQKAGCTLCGYESMKVKQSKTKEQFIKEAKEIHNNKYDYSLVNYKNIYTPITIICPIHGKFEQIPHNHLSMHAGCPKCKNKSQYLLFKKLQISFPKEEIVYETGKEIEWLKGQRFDIYFPKYNIAVEYNGEQHYKPILQFGGQLGYKKTIERDQLKREKCKNNNCILFELRYDYTEDDYNNIIKQIKLIIDNYEN